MTTPDEQLPMAGTAEPGGQHDPEAAEAYAESVSIDPSPDEINEYLKIAAQRPSPTSRTRLRPTTLVRETGRLVLANVPRADLRTESRRMQVSCLGATHVPHT